MEKCEVIPVDLPTPAGPRLLGVTAGRYLPTRVYACGGYVHSDTPSGTHSDKEVPPIRPAGVHIPKQLYSFKHVAVIY